MVLEFGYSLQMPLSLLVHSYFLLVCYSTGLLGKGDTI